MSTCISSEGEYSDHVPDKDFCCTRCFALDEPGLLARVRELETENDTLRFELEGFRRVAEKDNAYLIGERDAALSTIAKVEALHQPLPNTVSAMFPRPLCSCDAIFEECETARALGSVPSTGEGNE